MDSCITCGVLVIWTRRELVQITSITTLHARVLACSRTWNGCCNIVAEFERCVYQCLQLTSPLHYPRNNVGLGVPNDHVRQLLHREFHSISEVHLGAPGKTVNLPSLPGTIFLSLCVFGLLPSRWGCREHFVSGCWHSSGRDYSRYPRESWLYTLGVLHPGVPVMW